MDQDEDIPKSGELFRNLSHLHAGYRYVSWSLESLLVDGHSPPEEQACFELYIGIIHILDLLGTELSEVCRTISPD